MESVPQRTRHLLPRPNHYHLEMTGATHLHKRSDTPYLPGEMVTVTYDFDIQDTGVAEPNSAFLSLAVAGQFNNPAYTISPAGDGSLSHVFTGNEDGIGWELNDEFELGSVTVVCVAAQVPPTTTTTTPEPTTTTTIPEPTTTTTIPEPTTTTTIPEPTTTTTTPEATSSTTIPEVETDIADSGSTGVAAAALVVLGLLVLGVATVRSYRSES